MSALGALRLKAYDAVTTLMSAPLALVAPTAAARYRFGRLGYRTYLSGDRSAGTNANFLPRQQSADAEIRRGLKISVNRCRDQAMNNATIAGAVGPRGKVVSNVVRGGIWPQFQYRDRGGKKKDSELNKAWEALFGRWANYAGIAGLSWPRLQRLVFAAMWTDGEIYIHRLTDLSVPGVPSLRLELIERDQLDVSVDGPLANGNLARMGKEFSPSGCLVALYILPAHPGDYQAGTTGKTTRVPASEIIDVHDAERSSQTAGMPWLSPVVMEAYDMDEYRADERAGARLAASFGIVLKQAPGVSVIPGGMAGTGQWQGTWQGIQTEINRGHIQVLPAGADFSVVEHARPGGNYDPYVRESRRTQSAGIGMSYEAFSNDYTSASYSSARSAALEERLGYQGMQDFLIAMVCHPVLRWFIDACVVEGLAPGSMPGYADNPYPWLESVDFQVPGWSWVDPVKDATASRMRYDDILTSKTREAAALGLDLDELVSEQTEETQKLIELAKLKRQLDALSPGQAPNNGANNE